MNKKKEELTAADVWAMFAEAEKRMEKTDERIKEIGEQIGGNAMAQAEIAKRIKEIGEQIGGNAMAQAETDKMIKKLGEQIGGVSNNAGFHAEQFFQDALAQTLTFGGEKYDYFQPNFSRSNKTSGVEFDIVLVNGKSIAVIEAKNRIHPKDVKVLAEEKVAKLRNLFPEYKNHKVYLGVAGFSFSDEVLEETKKYGVGIIKQVGQSIEVEADKLTAY